MHKRRCKRAREDANAQGKIQMRKGRCEHARVDPRKGRYKGRCKGSSGNCKGGRVLMTTDGSRQM